jgi:hypothetical protein
MIYYDACVQVGRILGSSKSGVTFKSGGVCKVSIYRSPAHNNCTVGMAGVLQVADLLFAVGFSVEVIRAPRTLGHGKVVVR